MAGAPIGSGLMSIISLLGGGAAGYAQGRQQNIENEQKKSILDIQRAQLDLQKRQNAGKEYQAGLTFGEDGTAAPRPDYLQPGMNYPASEAFYKRQEHPTADTATVGDIKKIQNVMQGGQMAPEDAGIKVPNAAIGELFKPKLEAPTAEQATAFNSVTGRQLPPGTTAKTAEYLLSNYGKQNDANRKFETVEERHAREHKESVGLRREEMSRQDKKDLNQQVRVMSDDIQKRNLPELAAKLEEIDKYTGILSSDKPDLSGFQTTSEAAVGSLPWIGGGLQSRMAESRGGEKTRRTQMAVQGVFNAALKATSGGAVTPSEAQRSLLEKGMAIGASPEAQADGIRAAYSILKEAEGNTFASVDPEAARLYKSRGGYKPMAERSAKTGLTGNKASSTVRVQLPDGSIGNIPAANLNEAIKLGAKRLK